MEFTTNSYLQHSYLRDTDRSLIHILLIAFTDKKDLH